MVGTQFGRYLIETKVGEGAMGVVYRARDIKLDRLVAIKVLGRRMQASPLAWGRLLREAQIASGLNHPCICTIYDVGEEQDRPYIAMEYIEGHTLSALVKPAGLPTGVVRHYGTLIALALGHAHERGVIHRDIKSGNIVVSSAGQLKILDFGLAKHLRGSRLQEIATSHSSIEEIGRLIGTVPYLAPEILRGERANVAGDIWSLGVLLFEMTTGRLPFWGNTVFDLTARVMSEEPPSLPGNVPAALAQAIRGCLQKDALKRLRCARDVAVALGSHRLTAEDENRTETQVSSRSLAASAGA